MDKKFEDQKARSREITGARRRNNVYGEVDNYVIVAFLELGGDAAIIDRTNKISLYANSPTQNYVITTKVLYASTDSTTVDTRALEEIASITGAIPIYCIAREYSRRAKFFDLNHKKLKFI